MFRMIVYCGNAVDHFLKMWKSLTPKSIYRALRFLLEIALGLLGPDRLAGSAAFRKCTNLENIYRVSVNLLDLRSESEFVIEICFGAMSIRNRVWPLWPWLAWLGRFALAFQ